MRTIDWVDGAIRIIDQTRLPAELVTVDIREVDELVDRIRSLAVRGAMALGVAGALGMALAAHRAVERAVPASGPGRRTGCGGRPADSQARPTAVNLSWGVARAPAAGGPPVPVRPSCWPPRWRSGTPTSRSTGRCPSAGADLLAGTAGCSPTAMPARWPGWRSVPRSA